MKYFTFLLFFIFIALVQACSPQNSKEILFSETGNDWEEKGDAKWSFSNNEIIGISNDAKGFLVSTKSYRNFELNLEFNPDSTVNSGVFLRCNTDGVSATNCYEINIWDLHPNQDNRTGAIVGRLKPFKKVETLNQWNTYKIECKNNTIKVWVNGILTAKLQDDQLVEGTIAIQAAATGKVKFRNIIVTPLN